jgi:hypothetical protein
MSFLRLRNDLALQLVDQGVPASVIRGFLSELERRFSRIDPASVPASRNVGMNTNVLVDDPDDPKKLYVFYIRLARNDEDFWVSSIKVYHASQPFLKPPD